jgi:glycerol-3-phosphate acyltransferase PlsY
MKPGWEPFAALALGYFLGAIPTALWVCRVFFKLDITSVGSGNPGMTNVWRVLGWKPALPVALIDAAKGSLAAWLGAALMGSPTWGMWAGVAAVLGHSFSFWAGFKGGKGVLTALGVFLYLSPVATLAAFAVWSVVMAASRIVSLSSVVAASLLPVSIYLESGWRGRPALSSVFWASLLVGLFVIIRHRSNLIRLLQGTEPRFQGKSR